MNLKSHDYNNNNNERAPPTSFTAFETRLRSILLDSLCFNSCQHFNSPTVYSTVKKFTQKSTKTSNEYAFLNHNVDGQIEKTIV